MLAALAMTALSAGAVVEIALAAALRSRAGRRRGDGFTGVGGVGPVVADSGRLGSAEATRR